MNCRRQIDSHVVIARNSSKLLETNITGCIMSQSGDEFDAVRDVVKALENFSPEDQQRILRWAAEKLGLSISPAARSASAVIQDLPQSRETGLPAHSHSGTTNIKSFVEFKKPKNDKQFAAVVAYYYQFEAPEAEQKDAITKEDLVDACRKANHDRPPVPGQTLLNAVSAGLLDKVGKGLFSVNSVGENLVAITLPGDGSIEGVTQKRKGKSPKKRIKIKKKKK